MSLGETLFSKLEPLFPEGQFFLAEPTFQGLEKKYLMECIDSTFVSSVGAFVDRFEVDLQKFTGAKRAVVTVNGTSALHLCSLLCGVSPGDEVFMPAMTFVATANSVAYIGATPHFVESSPRDLGVCVDSLETYLERIGEIRDGVTYNKETGKAIRALICMHTFGHISPNMDRLKSLCEVYKIALIEDAAEALGSRYKGHHAGHWGRVSALSFNGNKIMTTGGGGAVISQDPEIGQLAKKLSTTAKVPHPWRFFHDEVAFNYRMPNLNAALGCAQLEQMETFLKAKKTLQERYLLAFQGDPDFEIFQPDSESQSNFWLMTLVLKNPSLEKREDCLKVLNQKGIGARPVWDLMSDLPAFKDCPSMNLENTRQLSHSLINLPSSVGLAEVIL